MTNATVTLITPDRLPALHALNQRHATELSSLTPASFASLIAQASYARAVEDDAFIIAFDRDADYDSPNFLWFRDRYDSFVYVDRIVVGPALRGQGVARALYTDLFAHAREAGHRHVVAEINAEPPNPTSDAFHEAMGFTVVGSARLEDRAKAVRYVAHELTASTL